MVRVIIFLSGLGSFFIGAASYVPGVPLPINCKTIVCHIGTAALSLDLILMGVGVLLILISLGLSKSRT